MKTLLATIIILAATSAQSQEVIACKRIGDITKEVRWFEGRRCPVDWMPVR